jgi:tyrosine-protein phosphatase YwqE
LFQHGTIELVSGYVDLHSHVLPGIDDGPSELEGSIAMLRAAAESGVSTLAATPHLQASFPAVDVRELAGRCQELRDVITREGIEIRLVSGAEVSLVWALEASEEDLRLATYNQGGADLLIETPSHSTSEHIATRASLSRTIRPHSRAWNVGMLMLGRRH